VCAHLSRWGDDAVLIVFAAKHLVALLLILAAAAAAGSLVLRRDEGLALRCALGLALCGHAAFFLAAAGLLEPVPIVIVLIALFAFARVRTTKSVMLAAAATGVLLFVPALYPPYAFDETLYHLSFVREFGQGGALRVIPELRFPVFPVLHELLAVPPFLLAGDTGTHLVALAAAIVIVALLLEWSGSNARAGWIAAALFLGSPLVIHLSTVLYVELALTLFVAAGFYALERERYAIAGFFLGSACSVKYLGAYFAAAALLIVIVRRRRAVTAFLAACIAAALPMTIWIFVNTGDVVFPYLRHNEWTPPAAPYEPSRMLTLLWDVTFARERAGLQPPITPFLIAMVLLMMIATRRDPRARQFLLLGGAYVVLFGFLPPDARYLVPLLPLISIAVAPMLVAHWRLVAVIAIAPGVAYAAYRVADYGVPPATAPMQHQWLARRVPEYRALRRAGAARVYACRAERLKSYAQGELLGDFTGPYSYERVLKDAQTTTQIAERMQQLRADYFLVAKRTCNAPLANGGMTLIYEDAHAQLWRVGEPLASFSIPFRLSSERRFTMAEQTKKIEEPKADCCSTGEREVCCAPEAKASCCGSGCGC
jgi:hypothetical protein